jgi:hypothetical protein
VNSQQHAQLLETAVSKRFLFKQLQIDCDNIEISYAGVINKCNEKIALLELNLSDLKNQSLERVENLFQENQELKNVHN